MAKKTSGKGADMKTAVTDFSQKHCLPCEGEIPRLDLDTVREYMAKIPGWQLRGGGKRIRREWQMKDFASALKFLRDVGKLAEEEDHHPDIHLTGYRNVALILNTHGSGGLSENDFILAAKINQVPVSLQK
jgi:4a-hydroxytetrahydrobiopterin dehydratase